MKKQTLFISFAEGRLGDQPIRLDLIADTPDWIAVTKPSGLVVSPDPWYSGSRDLISALRAEIAVGKPQLKELDMVAPVAINRLDRDESGVLLIAKNDTAGAELRNQVGSAQLHFTYTLLAEGPVDQETLTCDLPLARHKGMHRMLVSHTTGKKASTEFRRIESFGQIQCWEAVTDYSRPHQIRVHGFESDLDILGDTIYGKAPKIYLSELKRRFRRSGKLEHPIYDHLALHLSRVEFRVAEEDGWMIEAPLPRGVAVLIRRLQEFRGRAK